MYVYLKRNIKICKWKKSLVRATINFLTKDSVNCLEDKSPVLSLHYDVILPSLELIKNIFKWNHGKTSIHLLWFDSSMVGGKWVKIHAVAVNVVVVLDQFLKW